MTDAADANLKAANPAAASPIAANDPACPFGGFKPRGMGREMGQAAFDLYTGTKSVSLLA